MNFFKNFFVVFILVGVLTSLSIWFFRKRKVNDYTAVYLSCLTVGLTMAPILSFTIGFDTMIAEFVFSLILWLMLDLMWVQFKTKGG